MLCFVFVFNSTAVAVANAGSPHFVYSEKWHDRACGDVLKKVRTRIVPSPQPPDLQGDWTSSRCEIRSGPEYVLRHFTFTNNSFEAIVYHYVDPDCRHPAYTIVSHGTHRLHQPSWTVHGATEASYEVMTSYVITHSTNLSRVIAHKLKAGCKGAHDAPAVMKTYTKYLIYNATPLKSESQNSNDDNNNDIIIQNGTTAKSAKQHPEEKDCFAALHFSLHELQLVLVEFRRHHSKHHRHRDGHRGQSHRRPHHHRHRSHRQPDVNEVVSEASSNKSSKADSLQVLTQKGLTKELLLGAVHSRPYQRQTHRPSSFQTALKDATTPGCGTCSRVASATALNPPRLSSHTGTILSLEGEWVSTRCESRQYGMFLTRWLHFLPDDVSWQGVYDYYHDAACRQPSFSLKAKGSYAGGTASKLVPGAEDYSFKVTRLKVTPHDQTTANSLNHYDGKGCGKAHAWSFGEEQDVTWTGGCVTLGIRLPNMERDIMKMEMAHRKLHLYVGQRLVDREPGQAFQQERPTAFQEPLVKCDQTGLDMSLNTAPGGHSWAGGVALPLASAPEDWMTSDLTNGGVGVDGKSQFGWALTVLSTFGVIRWMMMI